MKIIACASCKHFDASRMDKDVCKAFPAGIPDSIAFGDNQHRDFVEGDRGIKWEPVEGMEFMDVPMAPTADALRKGEAR